jgi:hypothetical protein
MQRKAAGILLIEKEENSADSLVKALKVREGSPLDVPIIRFGWSKTEGRHVYLGEMEKVDAKAHKIRELRQKAEAIFMHKSHLSQEELQKGLMDAYGIQERTARTYIQTMKEERIVEKSVQFPGVYTILKSQKPTS